MKEKKSVEVMMKKYKGKQKLLIAEGLIFGLFSYWLYTIAGVYYDEMLILAVIDGLIAIWFTVRLFRGTSFKNEEELLRKNRLLLILAAALLIVNFIIYHYMFPKILDSLIMIVTTTITTITT